jgi:peroxiredoxin
LIQQSQSLEWLCAKRGQAYLQAFKEKEMAHMIFCGGVGLACIKVLPACLLFWFQVQATAQEQLFEPAAADETLIPQYLLPCIHASEVQAELKLNSEQIAQLEDVLRELDVLWWPSQNLEPAKQRETVRNLEVELLKRLATFLPAETIQRLQQLELQAQGSRLMLRPDVAARLGVPADVQSRFREYAEKAEKALADINAAKGQDSGGDLAKNYMAVKGEETKSGYALLNDRQKQALETLLGKRLNFSTMERIYALAPELVDTGEWAGSPVSLESVRGKVVIVHFYAFQCINCRNNFQRYNEWSEKFKNQDVAIIGVQTPETPAEADPMLVKEAAQRDKLQFPVLIDLGQKNWKAWGTTMWPTVYVIDKRGYIRMWWQGELNWQGATGDQAVADAVNKLLKE